MKTKAEARGIIRPQSKALKKLQIANVLGKNLGRGRKYTTWLRLKLNQDASLLLKNITQQTRSKVPRMFASCGSKRRTILTRVQYYDI